MTERPSPAALAEELAAIARIGPAWQPSPFDRARYRWGELEVPHFD